MKSHNISETFIRSVICEFSPKYNIIDDDSHRTNRSLSHSVLSRLVKIEALTIASNELKPPPRPPGFCKVLRIIFKALNNVKETFYFSSLKIKKYYNKSV